jgi:beta-glucanase (GH16 family)
MLVVVLAVSGLPACSWDWDGFAPPQPAGPPGRWAVTFDEECDGPLDHQKWGTSYFRNGSFRYYGWEQSAVSDANVAMEAGLCKIKLQDQPYSGRSYTSGTLDSGGKWEQLHGYFEIRARAARGFGLRSVFQLSHARTWPPLIDLRVDGKDTSKMSATVTYKDVDAKFWSASARADDFAAAFHVFGVLWTPDELTVYVDGSAVGSATRTIPPLLNSPLKFELTGYAGIDNETPDATTSWPAIIEIDWVRAYRAR